MSEVVIFLPLRRGSQRVKNKNTKDFCGIKGGLTYIKLSQLVKIETIESIIVSTNDDQVKNIARSFNNRKIQIFDRPDELASSDTSTDELIEYVPSIIRNGVVLWTHVTSPFIDDLLYAKAIEAYQNNQKSHDSLMSVTKFQNFLWNDSGPINYDIKKEKWPRTQTLAPLFEVNSGIFIANIDTYRHHKNRIGTNPLYFIIDSKSSLDIDWEEDFEIAESYWEKAGFRKL